MKDFDPPLVIRGWTEEIRTLEEAAQFLHRHPRLGGRAHTAILRRLQAARAEKERAEGAHAFRAWLEELRLLR